MRFQTCFALVLSAFPYTYAADPACAAASAKGIMACVLGHHPDILRAESDVHVASLFPRAAAQRPNPELDGQVTAFGKDEGPTLASEANLLHTFELGQKRKRRMLQAEARQFSAQARLRRTREQLAVETTLKLHRLRQIASERRAVEESMGTFGDIVQSLQSRPRRSAEQDVSLHVFLLAQADYQFQLAAMEQDETALALWFTLATGLSQTEILAALPPEPTSWPDIAGGPGAASGAQQIAAASVGESKANLALANSQAWPDLRAGPRIDAETGNGQENLGAGAAMSLALPLYQRNQGERQVAAAEAEAAKLNLQLTEREVATERQRWLAAYRSAVETWRRAPTTESIEKRHRTFEKEFHRGLIPASLTVEAHRQMVDFTKTRHEDELRALEALWSLNVLDGRFEGASL